MAAFRGTLTHELRGSVELEARQEGSRWICVARIGDKRFEQETFGELWGLILQKVTQQALDSPRIDASPSRSPLVKRTPPPVTQPRRRAIRSVINPPPET